MTELKAMTTTPELAKRFASSGPQTAEALRETFNGLNVSVHEKAKGIPPACAALSTAWDILLPVLSQMQDLLSQRGKDRDLFRDAGLPVWTEWLQTFKEQSGLLESMRTVQVRLSKYRSLDKPTEIPQTKRPAPPRRFSKVDTERLLEGAQYANELVTALDNHADYTEPLREFKRVAIGPDCIGRLLENEGSDRGFRILSSTPVAATVTAPVTDPPVPPKLTLPPKPLVMPKAGDCIGLFNIVNGACGDQIRAALRGLSPDLMANTFGKFVNRLALANCHFDQEAGEIRVTVEYLSNSPSALGLAA